MQSNSIIELTFDVTKLHFQYEKHILSIETQLKYTGCTIKQILFIKCHQYIKGCVILLNSLLQQLALFPGRSCNISSVHIGPKTGGRRT